MKALFIKFPQNVTQYRNHPNGWKFIQTVSDIEEAWGVVRDMEDPFINDDETMTTDSGSVAWEKGDEHFDFGDYEYRVIDLTTINTEEDPHLIDAIDIARPWNINEIIAAIFY